VDVTDSQFLPFPTDNDPAAGALDLQILAEAIDAKLVTAFANYRATLNKKIKYSTMLVNGSSIAANTLTTVYPTFSTWSVLYDSTGGTAAANPFDMTGFIGMSGGVYRAGMFLKTNPSGAVNANTRRFLQIEATIAQDSSPLPTVTVEGYFNEVVEANAGGTFQVLECEFFVPFVTSSAFSSKVVASYFHTNTSSTVTYIAGSYAWLYRVADLEL
jgi:hypothetical protein